MFGRYESHSAVKQYRFRSGVLKTVIFDRVSFQLTLIFSEGVDVPSDLNPLEQSIHVRGGQPHIITRTLTVKESDALSHVIDSHERTFATIKVEIMAMIDSWSKADLEEDQFLFRI